MSTITHVICRLNYGVVALREEYGSISATTYRLLLGPLLSWYGALSRCGWNCFHMWITAIENSYAELSAPESK
jgi:hypothetical protein